jgi:hypothetical protein
MECAALCPIAGAAPLNGVATVFETSLGQAEQWEQLADVSEEELEAASGPRAAEKRGVGLRLNVARRQTSRPR